MNTTAATPASRHAVGPFLGGMLTLALLGVLGGTVFFFSGAYNIGADAPHTRLVYGLLERFRERSIAAHAAGIVPPDDLGSTQRVETGAGLYTEMCAGCHLGPGVEKSEMSQGLYPRAPVLAKISRRPANEQFWLIKHGVKLSAMPAWGPTHSDKLIWDIVAFVQALPGMTPEAYRQVMAKAPADHDETMQGMAMKSSAEPGPPHDHADKDADHAAP